MQLSPFAGFFFWCLLSVNKISNEKEKSNTYKEPWYFEPDIEGCAQSVSQDETFPWLNNYIG